MRITKIDLQCYDYLWFAIDANGCIIAFTSGGIGDGNERCLVLGHSMQTNERHYSFSDRRKVEDVRNKLKNHKTA